MKNMEKLFTRVPLALLLALVLALSLCACGSSSREEETESSEVQTQAEYTFEVTDGPSVTISIDLTDGYEMYTSPDIVVVITEGDEEEETEENPAADIDFDGADFVITYGDDIIYGIFSTVSEATIAELYYYSTFEKVEIAGLEGFYVQGSEDEYDLLLELEDHLYVHLYTSDENIDLQAAAERLTITFSTSSEEEESSTEE